MAHRTLDHIEQSIAETEMRITQQRALMEQKRGGIRETIAMAVLQDALRQKMRIRRDIQRGIGIPALA